MEKPFMPNTFTNFLFHHILLIKTKKEGKRKNDIKPNF